MHSRAVLTVLILASFTSGFTFYTRENLSHGGSEGLAVVNLGESDFTGQVAQSFEALSNEIKSYPNKQTRLDRVKNFYSQVQEKRRTLPPQKMSKEVGLDLMLEPLKPVVNVQKFDSSHCPEWQHRIQADFEPSPTGEITEPHLKKAQRVIASICE